MMQRTYVHPQTHVRSSANARTSIAQCTYVRFFMASTIETYITQRRHQISLMPSLCRGDRARTCDSLVPNQERYQLRYTSVAITKCCSFCFACAKVVLLFYSTKCFGKKNHLFLKKHHFHSKCSVSSLSQSYFL